VEQFHVVTPAPVGIASCYRILRNIRRKPSTCKYIYTSGNPRDVQLSCE